jgi:ubiquinone/menaquinone biosynthesis C-methylase UbiE
MEVPVSDEQPTPDLIMQLITGGWGASILAAGVTHSVFTRINDGETTVGTLAKRAGLSVRGTQALLDGLTGLGLLEVADGSYRNSLVAAAFLVEGRPAYLGSFAKVVQGDMPRWLGLSDVVRNGVPPATDILDVADNPFWEVLVPAIAPMSVPSALIAAEQLHLADAGSISILDVGGGSGVFSSVWLGMNPAARSTQIDWPPVNAIARRLVAEAGVGDRFSCVDGDFHSTDFGTAEHDLAVLSHIAHQEGPESNVAIFTKFRRALKPGATLVVNDFVLEDDRSGPAFPLIFHSQMLLGTESGAAWRKADYRSWLAEAGFTDVSFHATPSPATLVFAR